MIVAVLVWLQLYTRDGGGAAGRGMSLMSLISEYRNFASEVVFRLEHDALGPDVSNRPKVLICIGMRLDKIIEFEEVRIFLRRMKGVFEIPGIDYYLSLSEDSLAALYLGSAEGKNEIDSSLDHIVRIPPLTWEECREVADAYLQARSSGQIGERAVDILVAVSYGIPRD